MQSVMMRTSDYLRRYRWLTVAVWLILIVAAVGLVVGRGEKLTGGGFEVAGSQSLTVHDAMETGFREHGASPLALVAAPRPDATVADMTAAVDYLKQVAGQIPQISVEPIPPQLTPQPDRPFVVTLRIGFDNTGATDIAKDLRKKIGVHGGQPGQIAGGRVSLYVIGQGALGAAMTEQIAGDIKQAEKWNIPVILIVLIAAFGSLAAASLPLLLGLCTVALSVALVLALSNITTISVFALPTVTMIGLAVAVDYSLFILMRYREELNSGKNKQEAIAGAMATSGLTVTFSGLTVIAALAGIYLIGTPALASMASGAIIVVAIAVLTSTTLMPALLAIFGKAAANQSRLLRVSPLRKHSIPFWRKWTQEVMRRPWLSALGASIFLLALAAPSLQMQVSNSMLRQFDSSHEIRRGIDAAAVAMGPGALGPVQILLTFDGDTNDTANAASPVHAQALETAKETIAQAPNIARVSDPIFSTGGHDALISAVLSVDPEATAARDTVSWLRANVPDALKNSGADINVGGPTALLFDYDNRVEHSLLGVFAFVCVLAFVMLLATLRSPVLALKGVVMTVLSVAAAYGSLVIVFQWGWLEFLGFHKANIDSSIPPLALALTFGLTMDYEIFLLARVRERYLRTGDCADAVSFGVRTSARTITSAALIMIAVFIGFAFAGMPLVAQLGVACAVAIAVDATVVRLVLVPALMAMFDQRNWWLPGWLDRVLPTVDFETPCVDELPGPHSESALRLQGSGLEEPRIDYHAIAVSAARLKRLADGGTITAPDTQSVLVDRWRDNLTVALEALQAGKNGTDTDTFGMPGPLSRVTPVEITQVKLPTGQKCAVPTDAEALRMQGLLLMRRNAERDYTEFARLASLMEPQTAAKVLAGLDQHYCVQSNQRWVSSQLVRRLADPKPGDGAMECPTVRRQCLSVAVAMLEDAR
ncbi:Membrane protein YdfJ [Mycobacteroides salmoniphilum]|uniref:Membrane protein YdfJ n=2 Tax=Mycobacteroides salmoniphilum TaxID=404941 RepID=A0A4R8SHR4_9MYCO|nr:Membrane protein YdfJ [Mycobacteroides salmoniphilum]TEA05611.1 Membrane protein YdfJ [Mycobacteroides salmoniphilum]